MNRKWWQEAVVYQIYPKSFQDSNGDGIGDLRGIMKRMDYLKELGVNTIWLCPINASPMKDGGYDISDYMKIDPSFGTNEDFKELIECAKKAGIRVLMDLVVNHCSDQHEWFKQAVADPNSKYAAFRNLWKRRQSWMERTRFSFSLKLSCPCPNRFWQLSAFTTQ